MTRSPPTLSEAAIQKLIRNYLAAVSIDSIHVPNGAVLAGDKVARAKQIAKLKSAGVTPGCADLILFDRRARRVGFMEVKSHGGRIQPSQERFAEQVKVWGWPHAFVRSVDDAVAALNEWGWR